MRVVRKSGSVESRRQRRTVCYQTLLPDEQTVERSFRILFPSPQLSSSVMQKARNHSSEAESKAQRHE